MIPIDLLIIAGAVAAVPLLVGLIELPGWLLRKRMERRLHWRNMR